MANGFDKDRTDEIIGMLRQTRTIVMVAAAASVLALATSVVIYNVLHNALLTSQGTEPPIRVKGGSLHFELLGPGSTWQPGTPGTEDTDWSVEPGFRYTEGIQLQIGVKNPTAQCPVLATGINKVTFTYTSNDGTVTNEVTVDAKNKKTKIKAKNKMKKQPDGSVVFDLEHEGYISAIRTPGNAVNCTFTSSADLNDVIVSQW